MGRFRKASRRSRGRGRGWSRRLLKNDQETNGGWLRFLRTFHWGPSQHWPHSHSLKGPDPIGPKVKEIYFFPCSIFNFPKRICLHKVSLSPLFYILISSINILISCIYQYFHNWTIIELKKLSNWWCHKYIIYKLLKFKIIIKIKIIIYILFEN